jgi:predicted aspartyl protease
VLRGYHDRSGQRFRPRSRPFRHRGFRRRFRSLYSVVPGEVLEDLGIEPTETRSFFLADGQEIERRMGLAVFEYLGHRTAAPVIFGNSGDSALMGATMLEGFGFVLDPFRRELRPAIMRM